MTSAQASWTAWQVPGVKSVKNGSHGEGKGLGFQSHDRRAIRPSISGHSRRTTVELAASTAITGYQ